MTHLDHISNLHLIREKNLSKSTFNFKYQYTYILSAEITANLDHTSDSRETG